MKCTCACHTSDKFKPDFKKMCWACDGTGEIQNMNENKGATS